MLWMPLGDNAWDATSRLQPKKQALIQDSIGSAHCESKVQTNACLMFAQKPT